MRFSQRAPVPARRWSQESAGGAGPASGDDRRGLHESWHVRGSTAFARTGPTDSDASSPVQTARRVWRPRVTWPVCIGIKRNIGKAELLYRDIVQRRTRLLGEEHLDTLRASFDLASVYAGQKRWDEFERLSRDVLAKQRKVAGMPPTPTCCHRSIPAGLLLHPWPLR